MNGPSIFQRVGVILLAIILLSACTSQRSGQPDSVTLTDGWFVGQPLYEVYLRAYSPEGTFDGLTKDLDRLDNLGIDILWLMPIHPIGVEGRKGSAGCPYSVQDYFAVGQEYGTLDDLKLLVREAHKRDMKVILDVVMNHSANDHLMMEEYPDWYMRDEDGNFSREVADWSDITDWNHDNEHARNHLISALVYWIEEADIDGYRCDVAGMVPDDFWREAIHEIRELKPNAFMLAEWEEARILDTGFDAAYDWNLYHRMRDHVRGEISTDSLWKAIDEKHQQYPADKQAMRFIENHDEPRAAKAFGWPELKPYAALIFTLPGIPLIYNGEEIGEIHKPTLFESEPIDWAEGDEQVEDWFAELLHLRNAHPSLLLGTITRFKLEHDGLLMFERVHEDERVLVVINFTDSEVTVKRPKVHLTGDYHDVATGERLSSEISVPAYGYHVFAIDR